MRDLYFNTPENKNIETIYCSSEFGHSIGFLMASQENNFFKKLLEFVKFEYDPSGYQSMGAPIYNKYFPNFKSINDITPAINMTMDVVYPYNSELFDELFNSDNTNFSDKTIGIHWYAGDNRWEKFINETNGGLNNLPNNVIGKLLYDEL